jgi:hypothetical protein
MYMPYKVEKKGDKFRVENELTHKVHSKGTTKAKAMGQLHLLNAIDHGFVPLHSYHSKNVPRGGKRKTLEN